MSLRELIFNLESIELAVKIFNCEILIEPFAVRNPIVDLQLAVSMFVNNQHEKN